MQAFGHGDGDATWWSYYSDKWEISHTYVCLHVEFSPKTHV